MTDLSRKRERERLPERHAPYFQRVGKGAYLGFRRGSDTWTARFRARDGKQLYKSLGGAPMGYDEAKKAAEEWLAQLAGSSVRSLRHSTVRVALEAYVEDLWRHGRDDTAREAEGRFKTVVFEDLIADLPLESVTRDDFHEWRERIHEGRQARTVNRSVRAVVAALNRTLELG